LLWVAIGFALATRITRHKTGEEQHVSTALA
jgi:hypothetical protein